VGAGRGDGTEGTTWTGFGHPVTANRVGVAFSAAARAPGPGGGRSAPRSGQRGAGASARACGPWRAHAPHAPVGRV